MTKGIDILSFDAVKASEQAFPLAIKNTDGSDVGITFKVLGRHSDAVQKYTAKIFHKMQVEEARAKKTGKERVITIDELREQGLEGAVVRVVGWEGVTQDFSVELLRDALKKNPHWQDQITEASNEDANFTKAS